MESKALPQRRGYPLIALFLVLTACGIAASLVGPAIRGIFTGTVGPRDALTAGLVSSIVIMLLGAAIGMLHYHRGRGLMWGIITGGAIGAFVGPMVVAPRDSLGAMLGLSLGGTLVVLLMTAAYRFASRSAKN